MKTSVEISGYTISIEETEGVISVNAVKDDEVVEEFTIEIEEGQGDFESQGEEGEDVRPFGEYGEEEDFEGEGDESQSDDEFDSDEENMGQMEDEDEDEDEDEEEGKALESFQSFINKKRK